MNKKQYRRRRDIKSKLMAAICMLLVSSIMMVSTTYAWFTLSTAPEVTGITTAVGANGNLEMALQPYNGASEAITSGTSDSMATQDVALANVTWGNLVDLSRSTVYGLDKITMYPAALNLEADTTVGLNPLSTPEYGADGRVSDLVEKTITGVWNGEAFAESISVGAATVENAKGVRAIGVSSGMSDRQLAYRAAMSSASTADSQAKRIASTALNDNGSILADVAIAHALKNDLDANGAETAFYTAAQIAAMRNVLTALVGDESGALVYIENAIMNYILADTLASAGDDTYTAITEAFDGVTLDTIAGNTYFATSAGKMTTYIGKLRDAKAAATTALSSLPTGNGPFKWSEISSGLGGLVNTTYLKINNMLVADVMADPGKVAGSIMKNGLTLTMTSGAGVFADVADFCGDYKASIMISELKYGTLEVENVEATMVADTDLTTVYLDQAEAAVAGFSAGEGSASGESISDYYGYIIDLAFRTNAADSYLQLQSDAIDRVYAGNEQNEATMGGGTYMKFEAVSENFTQEAMKRLMGAIRIVFFDTDDREIIAYARLDATKVDPDTSTGIKMPLVLTDKDGNVKKNGENNDYRIMALDQNVVHELSVMVYLDGNVVENKDVAFDSAKSMSGSMNLQFSSSATLVPMEYTDLRTGTGETTPATPEYTDLGAVTFNSDIAAVTKGEAVLSDGKVAVQLNGWAADTAATVTIKVGEGEAQTVGPAELEGVYGVSVTAPEGFDAATTPVVVTVTATPNNG